MKRNNRVEVRLTDDQLSQLDEVAHRHGMDRSEAIRFMISKEYQHEHGMLNEHLIKSVPMNLSGDEG